MIWLALVPIIYILLVLPGHILGNGVGETGMGSLVDYNIKVHDKRIQKYIFICSGISIIVNLILVIIGSTWAEITLIGLSFVEIAVMIGIWIHTSKLQVFTDDINKHLRTLLIEGKIDDFDEVFRSMSIRDVFPEEINEAFSKIGFANGLSLYKSKSETAGFSDIRTAYEVYCAFIDEKQYINKEYFEKILEYFNV